ncbi:MAG: hypothetical protein Q7T17_02080 [Microbacterium sp.]|uniref:hypothetical protein n=1 Tax=Microbacterium sp. TaxID=51671 RepID=UPI002715D8BD|nr:hypothetical protein [Microbacterium sp.]MDO8381762.1 hypothetical protein [Microbacterium sp.]
MTSPVSRTRATSAQRTQSDRAAHIAARVEWWTAILVVALGILPIVVVAVIGLAQGTVPDSEDGGILGSGPGYPLFQPPFWLLWVPAVMMFGLSIATFPLPLQRFLWGARLEMSTVAMVGFGTTLAASVAYGGQHIDLAWASLLHLAAITFFGIRALLGTLGWLPESWRIDPKKRVRGKASRR